MDIVGQGRLVGDRQRDHFCSPPQALIVGGEQRLHQQGLAQQRAHFARRFLEFDACDLGREPQVVGAKVVGREMRRDTLAQIDALADVERQRVETVEAINAGRLGDRVQRIRRKLRRQARDAQDALNGGIDVIARPVAIDDLRESPEGARIAQCAMPIADRQRMALDQGIEIMAPILGVEPARKLHRTKHPSGEGAPEAAELVLEKAVVEARVVRDEDAALDPAGDFVGNLAEGGRAGDHCAGDPGQALYLRGNAAFRIDQRAPLAHPRAVVDADDADLGDAILRGDRAGGFEIDEGDGRGEHRVAGRLDRTNDRSLVYTVCRTIVPTSPRFRTTMPAIMRCPRTRRSAACWACGRSRRWPLWSRG